MTGRARSLRLGAASAVPPSSRRRPPVPRGSPHGVPDVRDGLTRVERIILVALEELQREYPGRGVPTATLYGRVVEHVSLSEPEFIRLLTRLLAGRT